MILSRCTAILWKYVSVCLCLSAWRSLLSGTIRTVCLTRSMCASQPAGLHEKQKGVNLSERKSERRLHPRLLVFHFLSCHVFNQHYSSLHFSFFFFAFPPLFLAVSHVWRQFLLFAVWFYSRRLVGKLYWQGMPTISILVCVRFFLTFLFSCAPPCVFLPFRL